MWVQASGSGSGVSALSGVKPQRMILPLGAVWIGPVVRRQLITLMC